MTHEELKTTAHLIGLLDKQRLIETLSKEELADLCYCLHEDVEHWQKAASTAREQLMILLCIDEASKEFQKIFEGIIPESS